MDENDRSWTGSPLDVSGMDPYGIREMVIEFDNGDTDVFRPKIREEFKSYELHQMAVYLEVLSHGLGKDPNRLA